MTNQEINERVAKALGWKVTNYGEMRTAPCCGLYSDRHWYRGEEFKCEPPNYSGSIEAAWEIVEHIKSWGMSKHYPMLACGPDGTSIYQFSFYSKESKLITSRADTAPMAICLAFLKIIDSRSETVRSRDVSATEEGERD